MPDARERSKSPTTVSRPAAVYGCLNHSGPQGSRNRRGVAPTRKREHGMREIDSPLPRNSGPSRAPLEDFARRGPARRREIRSRERRGRIVEARDTKPVYRAGMIYTLADLWPRPRCTHRHLPLRLSLSLFLSLSMVPRARLNNINYARSEKGYARGGYTRLPHRPLRCPPVSNATINYPTVAATALARLSVSLSLSRSLTRPFSSARTLIIRSRSFSFVSRRSFSLSLSLSLPQPLSSSRRSPPRNLRRGTGSSDLG